MNLIIGGTGFLGAHLSALLLKNQQDVKIFKRETSSLNNLEKIFAFHFESLSTEYQGKIKYFNGDILDPFSIESALKDVSHVYNCSAIISYDKHYHKQMYKVNVEGTENLVNVLLNSNVDKFCHVSSIAAYGNISTDEPINETVLWEDNSGHTEYSKTKYMAEIEVHRAIAEGLPAIIVQPGIIIGPCDKYKLSYKIFTLVSRGLRFYTSGKSGFVYVEDVAEIMFRLMKSDVVNESYIIVSENLSYQQILSEIAHCLGKKTPYISAGKFLQKTLMFIDGVKAVVFNKPRNFTPEFVRIANIKTEYDSTKIKTLLDYNFIKSNDYINKTCSFFRKNKMF